MVVRTLAAYMEEFPMAGRFNLDKAHGNVPDHLDHVQWTESGAILERYDKYGNLIDTRFGLSNSLARDLGVGKGPCPLPDVGRSLPPVSG